MTASSPVAPDSTDTPVRIEDGREVGRRAEGFLGAETLVEFVRDGQAESEG